MSHHPFPFLSLPGEVRNIIYRHALVAKDDIHILDMHPEQYETTKRCAKRFRGPYQTAKSLDRHFCSVLKLKHKPCHGCRKIPDFFRTIYTMDADHNSDLSPALLRTNEQIRREAHSIFNQENTFFFYSMGAVMPFLKDRTPESLAEIKSIGFHLKIDRYVERNPVYLNWVCTFREVGCMAGLNLQNLSLKIEGHRYGPSYGGWWAANGLDWAYSVTRIGGLQELHIEFDLGSTRNSRNGKMLGVEGANAAWLWCWLAPRMLTDRKGAIDKAAAYLKSAEATREKDYLFVLNGVRGGEMVWDLRKAMQ